MEFEAVVVEAVPVVRGVAPLVDLAAPDVEALRLLGGADGRDGEESDHFASGGAALDCRARRPGGQTDRGSRRTSAVPGPRDGVRGARAS